MDRIIPSEGFPVMMRRGERKRGFKDQPTLGALLRLDARYSYEETEGDKTEISEIDYLGINEDKSPGEVLEIIEDMGAEPASMTQLLSSGVVDDVNELGLSLMALRHTVFIDGKEYSFYSSPEDGVGVKSIDEIVQLPAGSKFGIIRRKPIDTVAAA